MDKAWLKDTSEARLRELKREYRCYCNETTVAGKQLTYGTAAIYRSECKQATGILEIILSLINYAPEGEIPMSDAAETAWDRLLEPKRKG